VELRRALEKMLQPLQRKLRLMVTRGVVQLVDPSTLLQQLQLKAVGEEVLDNIEHWEPYGYTSRPHPGAEALLLSVGGDRDHTVAVNVADRNFRLKGLQSGEVALYTDEGDVIHFRRGNHIYVDAMTKITAKAPNVDVIASVKVLLSAPLVDITGDLQVGGNADITGDTTVGGAATVTGAATAGALVSTGAGGGSTVTGGLGVDGIPFGTHVHGGVQSGSSNTGAPQ
jgi:phage baseplate assembly protein V